MCGICGFNWNDAKLVKDMSRSIVHRGPDQDGFFTDDNASLGHRRLSIIDLSEKGRQPMFNEDKSIVIVLNGEIYNYLELRERLSKKHRFYSNSDTEVVIHAYEEYGPDCVKMLNGDFAFCIYDIKKKRFFLARDRLGIKPLYYFYDKDNIRMKDKFIFASEMKAILQFEEIKRKVNNKALSEFIIYRYTFSKETLMDKISRVQPGTYLIFGLKTHHMTIRKYWDITLQDFKNPINDLKKVTKDFRELFNDSVNKRLMSDVPVGAFLSGGLDSSAVVGVMRELDKDVEINTFSCGFNLEKQYDELKYAKIISRQFSTHHHEIKIESSSMNLLPEIMWHTEEPIADPAAIPVYLMSEKVKKKATVILTGTGADEVFGGYEHYKFIKYGKYLSKIPKSTVSFAGNIFLKPPMDKLTKRFFKYPTKVGFEGINRYMKFLVKYKDFKEAYPEIVATFDKDEADDILKNFEYTPLDSRYFYLKNAPHKDNLNSVFLRETKEFLSEQALTLYDKMSMASAVELRVPFVDHRIVELSTKIPSKFKLRGFEEKFILKEAFKNTLPKEIINRKKQGFYVPIDIWFEKDLGNMQENLLNIQTIKKQGYFNHEVLSRIIKKYPSSKLYYAKQLWSIISFQVWHEIFINERKISDMKILF
jgi:asparagine synthase (glutamine-hydrolysing)